VIQTWALLVDAYRELNSRKLFWITLSLSIGLILVIALVGVDDRGVSLLNWHWDIDYIDPHVLYRFIVLSFIVIGVWLSWGAVILALISTADAFPQLIEGGAIDLYLSKPMGRLRLFLTKYFFGLLFVIIQLTLFSGGCFLVVGLRAHDWRPSLFLAIPVILVLFSCVYAFCVLIGIWSRSTVAALLLAILLWLFFSGVQRTEEYLAVYRTGLERSVRRTERDRHNAEIQAATKPSVLFDPRPALARKRVDLDNQRLNELHHDLSWVVPFETLTRTLETVQPKTRDLAIMLDRYLLPEAEATGDNEQSAPGPNTFGMDPRDLQGAALEVQHRERTRSPAYIIGTSLAFEAVIVAIAAWLFCRRDY
jgi:hypothetical protein